MLKFTKDSYVDLDMYEKHLRYNGAIYVDKNRMAFTYNYECARRDTELSIAFKTMNANSANKYLDTSSDNIYDYLTRFEKCPEYKFKKKGVEGTSLDMKKVLKPLRELGYAKEFLDHYMTHRSLKSKCATIKTLLNALYDSTGTNIYNSEIFRLPFNVNQQKNLRYNYNNYDVIGIPKEYNDCITVKRGYCLAWGDFAQSDFRIAYNLLIRDERNAKIMDACEDKYEGLARIIADDNNEPFDADKFKEERDTYKVYTLATIYGTRNGGTEESNNFIKKFVRYLEKCPRYQEYYERINKRYELGLPLQVTGYFGHVETLERSLYNKTDSINDALNSPIQTGTSQVIILTVNKILEIFYSLGYTPEDISVYYVRHDEPIFIFKEEMLDDVWVFNQASTIIVDNWTPLKLTFEYGYRYSEVDSMLQSRAELSYSKNADKIAIEVPTVDMNYQYYPMPRTLELCVVGQEVGDKTIVCFYSDDLNAADYVLVDSINHDEVFKVIKSKLYEKDELFFEKDYRGALVWNNYVDEETYNRKMFYKFSNRLNVKTSRADILCSSMCARYATKYNILDYKPNLAVAVNQDFVAKVGALNFVV